MVQKILDFLTTHIDKALHFSAGYIIATILPVQGLTLSLIAGALKEYYDSKHPTSHTVDSMDMLATWAGGSLGFIALIIK